ncbi:hypothetical protein ACFL17_05805 [Pseudomonadota bacterium]
MDAMVDKIDIQALLRRTHANSATGFIYIFSEIHNRQEHGNITIREGHVVDAVFGSLGGLEILDVLLNMPKAKAYFVKSSRAALITGIDFPDIPTILDSLASPKINPEPESPVDMSKLVMAVQSVFEEAYGKQGLIKVQELTKLHPPERDPIAYLNECKESVHLLFGNKMTRAKFAPLYKMAVQL